MSQSLVPAGGREEEREERRRERAKERACVFIRWLIIDRPRNLETSSSFKKKKKSSGDAAPPFERGSLLVSRGTLVVHYRRAHGVVAMVITRAGKTAGSGFCCSDGGGELSAALSASAVADDAVALLVAACRGADVTPEKAAARFPELWIATRWLLVGGGSGGAKNDVLFPRHGARSFDAPRALAAAAAVLAALASGDSAPSSSDPSLLPVVGAAPAAALRGALAAAGAAFAGKPPPGAKRKGGGERKGRRQQPRRQGQRRRRLVDVAASAASVGGFALPEGALSPPEGVFTPRATNRTTGGAFDEEKSGDDASQLEAMTTSTATANPLQQLSAPAEAAAAPDSAAFPPVELLSAAPAAADGWASFGEDSAATTGAPFAPSPSAAAAAAAPPPLSAAPPAPATRTPTEQELSLVSTGGSLLLHESWRGLFSGPGGKLERAGVRGEVRLSRRAAGLLSSSTSSSAAPSSHSSADLRARFELRAPPSASNAVVEACLRRSCAAAAAPLVERRKKETKKKDDGDEKDDDISSSSPSPSLEANVGVAAASNALSSSPPPFLVYSLPAVGVPPPLIARMRLVPPSQPGVAGCCLVLEARLGGKGVFAPSSSPIRLFAELSVPDAAGELLRVSPRASWDPKTRRLRWEVKRKVKNDDGDDDEGSLFSFRAAFGPPAGSAPDALALSGVPGGGPASAAKGAVATIRFSVGRGGEREESKGGGNGGESSFFGSPFSGVAVASGAAASSKGKKKQTEDSELALGPARGSVFATVKL